VEEGQLGAPWQEQLQDRSWLLLALVLGLVLGQLVGELQQLLLCRLLPWLLLLLMRCCRLRGST